jgi:hypothetical protein
MARRHPAVFLMRVGPADLAFSTALIQIASTIYAACRPADLLATLIRVAFSAGHNRDAALRRFECFQRACACSLSTKARASSVMFSNSGHDR